MSTSQKGVKGTEGRSQYSAIYRRKQSLPQQVKGRDDLEDDDRDS